MELTDEIRKEVLKELVEKFEHGVESCVKYGGKKSIIEEWKITAKWLKAELEWMDTPVYKLLKEENE
jgi:hypothetical protein